MLVELNFKRLGEPDKKILAALIGITDVDHLTRMNVLADKASSWEEVLQTPSSWEEVWQIHDSKRPEGNTLARS